MFNDGTQKRVRDDALDQLHTQQRMSAVTTLDRLRKTREVRPFGRAVLLFNMYFQRRVREALSFRTVAESPLRFIYPDAFAYVHPTQFAMGLPADAAADLLEELDRHIMAHGAAADGGVDSDVLAVDVFWGLLADVLEASQLVRDATSGDTELATEASKLVDENAVSEEQLPALKRALEVMVKADHGGERSLVTVYQSAFAQASMRLAVVCMDAFVERFKQGDPPVPTGVREEAELLRMELEAEAARAGGGSGGAISGLGVDYIPTEADMMQFLKEANDTLEEDEGLYGEEIHDYYQSHQPKGVQPQPTSSLRRLIKPQRFCKVKTGYVWNAYNRAKYDAKDNPPPKVVQRYDFTLYFPLIVGSIRNLDNLFRVEYTEKGPSDSYCILVFSAGPPYADVAYRIVNQSWDRRKGGVRASFDDKGKFRLSFRFESSNYRR